MASMRDIKRRRDSIQSTGQITKAMKLVSTVKLQKAKGKAGNFYIEAENVQNSDLEADYIVAHFAILYPEPIPGAEVYIYGKFADWQLLPELKMDYDAKNKAYVGTYSLNNRV